MRTALLALASGVVLAALHFNGLLRMDRVARAFREQPALVVWSSLCILGTSLIGVVRHRWALATLSLEVSWSRVAAANLVSQAIAQWAPGSLAVSEFLRVTMLLGVRSNDYSREETLVRVAMSSLVDRAIGMGALFLVGSAAALYSALTGAWQARHLGFLLALAAATGAVGVAFIKAPQLANSGVARWLIASLSRADPKSLRARLGARLAAGLEHTGVAVTNYGERRGAVLVTGLLGALVGILTPASLWYASVAVGEPLPPALVAALVPTTILSVILPLGFAGYGGPQLLTAMFFAPFGVAAQAVLDTTLLQNSLTLAVQTALGLLFAVLRLDELTTILRSLRRASTESEATERAAEKS